MDERDVSDNRAEIEDARAPARKDQPPPATHTARITYLDGWRGVSILLVLASHTFHSDGVADAGVQMFFALSGRLMADILFVERFQPARRWLNRNWGGGTSNSSFRANHGILPPPCASMGEEEI